MACRLKHYTLCLFMLLTALCTEADIRLKGGRSMPLNIEGKGKILIEATAAARSAHQRQGPGKTAWGIEWVDTAGNEYKVTLCWGNTDLGYDTDSRYMVVEVAAGDSILESRRVTEGVNLYKGYNSLKLCIGPDGELQWNVGGKSLAATSACRILPATPVSASIFAKGGGINIASSMVVALKDKPTPEPTPFNNPEDFIVAAHDPTAVDGVWIFLDRDNDPKWARPGGRYTLGIMRSITEKDSWDIIYLDGAVTNAPKWLPGMRKGKLTATPFMGHYDLEWFDALFDYLDKTEECSATMNDAGTILTLSFPLDHSVMRFYRKQ